MERLSFWEGGSSELKTSAMNGGPVLSLAQKKTLWKCFSNLWNIVRHFVRLLWYSSHSWVQWLFRDLPLLNWNNNSSFLAFSDRKTNKITLDFNAGCLLTSWVSESGGPPKAKPYVRCEDFMPLFPSSVKIFWTRQSILNLTNGFKLSGMNCRSGWKTNNLGFLWFFGQKQSWNVRPIQGP